MQISKPTKKEKKIDAFISGNENNQSKNSKEELQSLNVKFNKEFHRAFKIYCLTQNITIQAKIREIVEDWSKTVPEFEKFTK